MLRKIRLTLAILFFTLITLLFLDFMGTMHAWFGWMAKIQFLPAVLALNVGVIVLLIALTLVLGRVYCSVICPLGVFQDVISWISGRRKKKKYRFSYSPAKSWLRYSVLALFILALIAGIGSFVALLAPYSSYGRIASNLFAPVYRWGNNLLAYVAERADSYAFYETDVWMKSLPTFIIAVLTFIIIGVLAWRNGRTYCNTICPVGTILGFLSRFSLLRITIDTDKCNACGLCSRKCKAACINGKEHTVDYSRCVACMDCIDTCRHGAISLKPLRPLKPLQTSPEGEASKMETPSSPSGGVEGASRRSFLSATAVLAVTSAIHAQEKKVDGGLAVIEDKKVPKRATPIVPPGALSARDFVRHCTACQLCVSVCPNGVLRPSTDLTRLMQPEMSYERGYCRPECTRCSEVCPAGAIRPITVAEKSSTRIGHAVWIKQNCIPLTDGVDCGNCARHCPSGAILMIPSDSSDTGSVKIPVINTERCIGCGACENLCPARPFSAIYVEGHTMHSEL
ncbi:4Fe-4S binding protein [Bacteroides sp. An51A]|uniref:4Fe-4S binding protein n=1 Tax=Bacteroides sp. An51A TaxID=1965640 RepID=UPI000B390915|nr:4Fe-4S binding protein [Bacteroides sp. An51A]OUN79863.1 ferredoxin [Bacteroides sp. An51A]